MKVVAFPFHDWRKAESEGFRTRDLHILDHLRSRQDVELVLVVDRPVSLAERWVRRRPWTATGDRIADVKLRRSRAQLTLAAANVAVLDVATPDLLAPAIGRYAWWFDVFRRGEVAEAIHWGMSALGIDDRRLIAWLPPVAPVVAALSPASVVFDSLDNWLVHPALRTVRDQAEAAYADMIPRARAVFASGPASARLLSRFGGPVQLLPNGVDPEKFARTSVRPRDLPPAPVVGYAGKLAERIDCELVVECASLLPDVAFVFVGPVLSRSAVRLLGSAANVLLLGDRPYEELPAYVSHFDVAWIPHRVGAGETGGDPIKLYEYWAAGRQVVTTKIDGWQAWTDQAHLVSRAEDAADVITGLLAATLPRKPAVVPVERTWRAITARVVAELHGDE